MARRTASGKASARKTTASKARSTKRNEVPEDWDDEAEETPRKARSSTKAKASGGASKRTTKATAKASSGKTTRRTRKAEVDDEEEAPRTRKTTAKASAKSTKGKRATKKSNGDEKLTRAQENGWEPNENYQTSRELGQKITDAMFDGKLKVAKRHFKELEEVGHDWTLQKYSRMIDGYEDLSTRDREKFLDTWDEEGYEFASNQFLGTKMSRGRGAEALDG